MVQTAPLLAGNASAPITCCRCKRTSCPTIFTNANGRILDRVTVYNRADHLLLTRTGARYSAPQCLATANLLQRPSFACRPRATNPSVRLARGKRRCAHGIAHHRCICPAALIRHRNDSKRREHLCRPPQTAHRRTLELIVATKGAEMDLAKARSIRRTVGGFIDLQYLTDTPG